LHASFGFRPCVHIHHEHISPDMQHKVTYRLPCSLLNILSCLQLEFYQLPGRPRPHGRRQSIRYSAIHENTYV